MIFKTSIFFVMISAAVPVFAAVTFHLAYRMPALDSKPFDFRNDRLRYVANEPYLAASDIFDAKVRKSAIEGYVISMHITPSAQDKINKLVADNIDALHSDHFEKTIAFAIVVDGEPKLSIQGMYHPINGGVMQVDVSNESDAKEWAAMINKQNEGPGSVSN